MRRRDSARKKFRLLLALLAASALCPTARPQSLARVPSTTLAAPAAATAQRQAPLMRPSNILDQLKSWMQRRRPRPSAREMADHANQLLAREGFDYDFSACEAVEARRPSARSTGAATERLVFDYTFALASGGRATFRLDTGDHAGMCGECFVSIPALRVTPREVLAVAGGRTYALKRPRGFELDEAHLVDEGLKKILRTWQLPYQTIPAGVSPDGRKLYVSFYEDYGLGEIVLELSDDGRSRFAVAQEVTEGREGEWIEVFPKDPKNAYLSYVRFRSGGKTHVVRFSGPCT